MSSLHRGHANLLCIIPILVYVLPKRALDMSLSKLQELVMDREAWGTGVHGGHRVGHDWVTELNKTELGHFSYSVFLGISHAYRRYSCYETATHFYFPVNFFYQGEWGKKCSYPRTRREGFLTTSNQDATSKILFPDSFPSSWVHCFLFKKSSSLDWTCETITQVFSTSLLSDPASVSLTDTLLEYSLSKYV